jgi:hypothetical protein
MNVKMTNLRVVTHSKYALAMMNQDFSGDNRFRSDGRKMLYFRKDDGGNWRIVREHFDNFMMKPVRYSAADIAGNGKETAPQKTSAPAAEVSSMNSGTKSL